MSRSAPLSSFVGRDDVLARVEASLRDGTRITSIVGPPGVGKSRLASVVAERTDTERWVFVPLGVITALEPALVGVANALSLGDDAGDRAAQIEQELLRRGRTYLVLDDAEGCLEVLSPSVTRWAAAVPSLRVLATTRIAGCLRDENVVELTCLATQTRNGAGDPDALRLWVDRARAADDTYDVAAAGERRDALAVVEALEGLPLAIELAASLRRVMSTAQIHEALRNRMDLLVQTAPAGSRHTSLVSAIESALDQIAADARSGLLGLATCEGGFVAADGEELLARGAKREARPDLAKVRALRDLSLLRRHGDGGAARLSVYAFFGARLLARATRDEIRDAERVHAETYAELVKRRTDGLLRGNAADDAWFTSERANVLRAAEWLAAEGSRDACAQAADVLFAVALHSSPWGSVDRIVAAIELARRVVRAEPDADVRRPALRKLELALAYLVSAHARRLDWPTLAPGASELERGLYERLAGLVARQDGRFVEAADHNAQSAALFQNRAPGLHAIALAHLATAQLLHGDVGAAVTAQRALAALGEDHHRVVDRLECMLPLVMGAVQTDTVTTIATHLSGWLALAQEHGFWRLAGLLMLTRAAHAYREGKLAEATALVEAMPAAARVAKSGVIADTTQGMWLWQLGRLEDARERLARSSAHATSESVFARAALDVVDSLTGPARPEPAAANVTGAGAAVLSSTLQASVEYAFAMRARWEHPTDERTISRARDATAALQALRSTSTESRYTLDTIGGAFCALGMTDTGVDAFGIADDGSVFTIPGKGRVSLESNPLLGRLLVALARVRLGEGPDARIDAQKLIDAAWGNERMQFHAGRARLRTAVTRLRNSGLKTELLFRDDGYHLASAWRVLPRAAFDRAFGRGIGVHTKPSRSKKR